MYDDIVKLLDSLGCKIETPADEWLVNFCIKDISQEITNECNTSEVPDGLYYVAVNMACGKVLDCKKGAGTLDTLSVEAAIKSIKEGDTQITYAVSDDTLTIDGLIETFKLCGKSQFAVYRRLKW